MHTNASEMLEYYSKRSFHAPQESDPKTILAGLLTELVFVMHALCLQCMLGLSRVAMFNKHVPC